MSGGAYWIDWDDLDEESRPRMWRGTVDLGRVQIRRSWDDDVVEAIGDVLSHIAPDAARPWPNDAAEAAAVLRLSLVSATAIESKGADGRVRQRLNLRCKVCRREWPAHEAERHSRACPVAAYDRANLRPIPTEDNG